MNIPEKALWQMAYRLPSEDGGSRFLWHTGNSL